jgi:hypothetical protein
MYSGSCDELTQLIDDATSLRTTKFGDQKGGKNNMSEARSPKVLPIPTGQRLVD